MCGNTGQLLSPHKTPGVSCGNGARAEDGWSKARVLEIQKISRFPFSPPLTFLMSTSNPGFSVSIMYSVKTYLKYHTAPLLSLPKTRGVDMGSYTKKDPGGASVPQSQFLLASISRMFCKGHSF